MLSRIIKIEGEESPKIILKLFETVMTVIGLAVRLVEGHAAQYDLKIGENSVPYTICDAGTEGTTPDCLIYTQSGPNIFCEITKTESKQSGNNQQFQRFTKFVPVLMDTKFELWYFLDNYNCNMSPKTTVAFRCWKTCGIKLLTNQTEQQDKFNALNNYETIEELQTDWNNSSKRVTSGKFKGFTQNINFDSKTNSVTLSNFNILKNDKLIHDPGIGTLMLLLATLGKLNINKITIKNHMITQKHVNTSNNKVFRSINQIKYKFKCEITFEDITYTTGDPSHDIQPFGCETTSEKAVSIREEYELKNVSKSVIYTNHARGEQEYLMCINKKVSVGKNIKKPDLIWADHKEQTIWYSEAEKLENYSGKKSGVNQIEGWKDRKSRDFFHKNLDTGYPNYKHKAYVTLYANDNETYTFAAYPYAKYILNKKGDLFENENFNSLDLNV